MRSKIEKKQKKKKNKIHTLEYILRCDVITQYTSIVILPFFETREGESGQESEKEKFKVVEMIYIIIFDDEGASFLWFYIRIYRIFCLFFHSVSILHSSMLFLLLLCVFYSFCSLNYALLVYYWFCVPFALLYFNTKSIYHAVHNLLSRLSLLPPPLPPLQPPPPSSQ